MSKKKPIQIKSTLEESVCDSIVIQAIRTRYIVFPIGDTADRKDLKNWDLWGPLLLCIMLAVTLTIRSKPQDTNAIFGTVFCLIWIGSVVVTVNAKLLGGKLGFFNSVCTLGYSLFPMNAAALINIGFRPYLNFWIIFALTAVSFLWSVKSASMYMAPIVPADTKGLALYPVFLFFIFIALFILHLTVT